MHTRLYQPTPHNLSRLASLLRRGGLVAVPSETVYGLAGVGLNPAACAAIFGAKERPANDPLILHIHRISQAKKLAYWNESAAQLAKAFWPGPLTVILPKRPIVPDIATSNRPSVALRMPAHPVFRALLRATNEPLAAPSANPFGYISPTTSAHVMQGLGGRIPAILEGGACEIGLESTIIDLRDPNRPQVLRPGAITLAQMEEILGQTISEPSRPTTAEIDAAIAPGQLARHYSPRTPLKLYRRMPSSVGDNEARIYYSRIPRQHQRDPASFVLAPDGRGETAAHNLFACLRELDAKGFTQLHFQLPPSDDPLVNALTDRLSRAAAR